MIELANPTWLWAYLIPFIIGPYFYRFIRNKRPVPLLDTQSFKIYLIIETARTLVGSIIFILGLASLIYVSARPQEQLPRLNAMPRGLILF